MNVEITLKVNEYSFVKYNQNALDMKKHMQEDILNHTQAVRVID